MRILAAIVCLLIGCGAILFALAYVDHMAALGPHGRDIVGGLVVVFLVFAPVGLALLMRQRPGGHPMSTVPAAQRYGLDLGVYGLEPGAAYRVIRPIKDFYGNEFPPGEILTYVQRHFLPYDGGHTVVFRPHTMYLQENTNADVLDALDTYLERVTDVAPTMKPTDLPPANPAPPAAANPRPLRVWQTKYSSTEMMCLLLYPDEVVLELQSLGVHRDRWTLAQALAGEADRTIGTGFEDSVVEELKVEIRARQETRSSTDSR